MRLTVEIEKEVDGRWIAEVTDLPGVMVYGSSKDDALTKVKTLALRVLADMMEHGETPAGLSDIAFAPAA